MVNADAPRCQNSPRFVRGPPTLLLFLPRLCVHACAFAAIYRFESIGKDRKGEIKVSFLSRLRFQFLPEFFLCLSVWGGLLIRGKNIRKNEKSVFVRSTKHREQSCFRERHLKKRSSLKCHGSRIMRNKGIRFIAIFAHAISYIYIYIYRYSVPKIHSQIA